jgi:[FeFe] hydrogenase (group B1/B3)
MQVLNDVNRIKREMLIKIMKEFHEGVLRENIDAIPCEMRQRGGASSRCCVYKDRAVLKYRIMAVLGIGVETETDETKKLADYLEDALRREKPDSDILSVLDVACAQCITSRYLITNACRGCLARPCVFNCPKNAIKVVDGRAKIDYSLCIDCGKCTNVCSYHAIIRVPIPCEEVCPVNAIRRDEKTDRQFIDFDACISCGKCLNACPFGAILERSQVIDIMRAIKEGKKVVAMVAPSIVGQFPGKIEQIAGALLKAGFHQMLEVALGAKMTTEQEAHEFIEKMENGERLMTTSCCPAYVETVKRHIPGLLPFVSETKTPMQYTSEFVKEKTPDAVTVFVGPCVAKRKEASKDINTDYLMTFEELGAMFVALGIDVAAVEPVPLEHDVKWYARGFATSCGVSTAILEEMKKHNPDLSIPKLDGKFINGIDRKAVKQLALYAKNKLPGNFLEVMACEGGCVGGPCVIGKVKLATMAVKKFAQK